MHSAETLKDLLDHVTEELDMLFPHSNMQLLYGSYLYNRTLHDKTEMYDTLDALLDKRADIILVVDDKEEAQRSLGKKMGWDEKILDQQLNIPDNSPLYYCLSTEDSVVIPLSKTEESAPVPYKIGLIGKESFKESESPYLYARLSKPVNILKQEDISSAKLTDIRNLFVDLVLAKLPKEFTGEEYLHEYVQMSYLFEVYRVFDFIKKKADSILNAQFFDVQKNKQMPMRKALLRNIGEYVNQSVEIAGSSFYESRIRNPSEEQFSYGTLLKVNLHCLACSFKNARTNGATNSSNIEYLARKFRK